MADALCFGGSTGSISILAAGGTPAYNYFWNNGQSGPNLTGLPAGNYILTMTDAAGCVKFSNFSVGEPTQMTANWSADSSANGWTVTLDVSGGTGAYDIQWSAASGNQTGPVAEGLTTGYYGVSITDANGCLLALEIPVGTVYTEQPGLISLLQLSPNPTPGPSVLTVDLIKPAALEVWVINPLGQVVYDFANGQRESSHLVTLETSDLPEGIYFVKIALNGAETRVLRLAVAAD